MSAGEKLKVKVTLLKLSKPFVKVIARNRNPNILKELKVIFDNAPNINLVLGDICVAFVSPTQYERCRIIKFSGADSIATVAYTDSGTQGDLPRGRLRILQDDEMKKMPPLCKEYVLAEVIIDVNSGYKDKVQKLHDEIINKNFELVVKGKNDAGIFVDLRSTTKSLVRDFIPKYQSLGSCFKSIILENQMRMMEERMRTCDQRLMATHKPQTLIESPETSPKKSESLAGSVDSALSSGGHPVRITTYTEGPFAFYVQFTKKDDDFQQFQCDLQKSKKGFPRVMAPSVGSRSLALVDEQYFRAEIEKKTGEQEYLVRLLESGAEALVPSDKIFMMPSEVSSIKPYAKKFKLANLSISHLQRYEIEFYFKHITSDKVLTLETVSHSGVPSCKLFHKNDDIRHKLERWNPHSLKYSRPLDIKKSGFSVIVCSIDSPKHFYVMQMKTPEHDQYMSMLECLKHFEPPKMSNPRAGDACLIKTDDVCMRNIIVAPTTKTIFKCKAVDTGFADEYSENEIRVIVEEFMKLPPMAIRCCLSGFESKNDSEKTTKRFGDICRRFLEFQMRIVKKTDNDLIVELEDPEGGKVINAMSASLETSDWGALDKTDWSSTQSSFNTHFYKNPLQESIRTLTESPNKSENLDEELSDEFQGILKNSTNIDEGLDSDWDGIGTNSDENQLMPEWESLDNSKEKLEETPPKPKENREAVRQKVNREAVRQKENREAVRQKDCNEAGPSNRKEITSSSSTTSGIGSEEVIEVKDYGEPAKMTAVLKPTDFTIQKFCHVAKYETYLKKLQDQAAAVAPLTAFDQGSYCLAFNRLTKKWCRAIILHVSLKDFLVSVKCVDDGNTFSIQEKSELKSSSLSLVFEVYFGIRCSLPIRYNSKREQEAIDYLMNIMNKILRYQEIAEYDNRTYIELFHNGKSVADALIEKGIAKRQWIVPSDQGFINYVVSITEFSVQMKKDGAAFDNIIEYTDTYVHRPIKNPQVGMLVIARYKQDKTWYRAKIESITGGIKVYFLDHGHSDMVEEIGALDNQTIADIPPIAFKCSLIVPKGFKSFSAHAEKKFAELADFGKKEFRIVMIKPGDDAALVEVFDNGTNIVNSILSAVVSDAKSPGNFQNF